MRRFVVLLLAVAAVLAGCGGSAPTQDSSAPSSEGSSAEVSQASVARADETQAPQSEDAPVYDVQPAQAQPLTWWREGLSGDKMVSGDFYSEPYDEARLYFYFYDDAKKVSYSAWDCFSAPNKGTTAEARAGRGYDLSLILNSAHESEDIGARILPDNFFELVARDDTKYTGEFFEKGIKLTRSLPGEGKGDSVLVALEKSDYAALRANLDDELGESESGDAAWLSMMRRSRMVSATITSSDGKATNMLDFTKEPAAGDPANFFNTYFYDDVSPAVYADSQGVAETSLPDAAKVEITFNNGLVFKAFYTKENLLVTASDVEGSLLYRLKFDSAVETIDDYAYKRVNVKTGKPVIYLYPGTPTDCTVTVGYPQFTYTYPAYDNGWRVTAYPDGRLINKADGSEHYYLFWEGNQRINWDFSKGFVIKGTNTEAFLREKLAYIGLTPREYNDFITYWVPRMQGAAYNLITFAGTQYEALAPLAVSPTPDSVLRVHMVFKAVDAPIEIPEQTLTPFERKGFAVVEWGATDAN